MPVAQWSAALIASLHGDLDAHLQGDLADSSKRSYASQLNQFRLFCEASGVTMVPEGRLLAAFIVGRVHTHTALATIQSGVAAVARWARGQGVPNLRLDPLVQQATRVAVKRAVRPGVQKLPLSHEQLRRLATSLSSWQAPQEVFRAARDRALFLVGWAGMFRSSELVALRWSHVHFFINKGMALFVPDSKTDPGEGAWVFLASAPAPHLAVCPVRALRAVQHITGGTGAVFPASEHSQLALHKGTVGTRLKKRMREAGLPDFDLYAAHSLRRGGATHAGRVGLPVRQIMVMGRWRSDAVRQYMYCSPDQLWQASQQLLRGGC